MNAIGRQPLFAEQTASFYRISGVAIFIQHIAERHADLRVARALNRRKMLLAGRRRRCTSGRPQFSRVP